MSSPCIFITGAGRRVGLYLAEQFLRRGYQVIAHYHTPSESLQRLSKQGAKLLQGDFSQPDSVEKVAHAVADLTPKLNAIIHNASCFYPTPRDDLQQAMHAFDQFYHLHMRAPALLNESLAPLLQRAAPADIIHITDIYAERPNPKYDFYCASKAGLLNLTYAYAKRWAPHIKVNAIAPGPIWFLPSHSQEDKASVLAHTPLGFEAGPEPIFKAALSLLDNPFITGVCLPVDGGRHLAE